MPGFSSLAEYRVPSLRYVSQLINVFSSNLDIQLINATFPRDICSAIFSISIPDPPCSDSMVRPSAKSKCYQIWL